MITGLINRVAGAVRHPISTAAHGAGLVKGLAASALRIVSGHREGSPAATSPPRPSATPAPQREPAPPGESFATEPHAASRDSEHGSTPHGGRDDDAVDDWYGEAAEPDTGPGGVVDALRQSDDDKPVDPGELKAIRTESEMLRKGAERDKG